MLGDRLRLHRHDARRGGKEDRRGHERKKGPGIPPEADGDSRCEGRRGDDERPYFPGPRREPLPVVEYKRGWPEEFSNVEPDRPALCEGVGDDRGRREPGRSATAAECPGETNDRGHVQRKASVEHRPHTPVAAGRREPIAKCPVEGRDQRQDRGRGFLCRGTHEREQSGDGGRREASPRERHDRGIERGEDEERRQRLGPLDHVGVHRRVQRMYGPEHGRHGGQHPRLAQPQA